MDISEANESLLNTVEKSDLMAAIGREIERIDRRATSNGYTNWVLWAAIGVIAWKALDLAGSAVASAVADFFVFLVLLLVLVRLCFRFVSAHLSAADEPTFVRATDFGVAGKLRALIAVTMCGACVVILAVRCGFNSKDFYLASSIFILGLVSTITIPLMISRVPLLSKAPRNGPARKVISVTALVIFALTLSGMSVVGKLVSWGDVFVPSSSTKIAVLLVVIVILLYQITKNVQLDERRELFQRLETELTLSSVGIADAKDRYEGLMLGMNVSNALRPWIDAVMIPLEEAAARVSETRHLIDKLGEAQGQANNEALVKAIEDRASVLLAGITSNVDKAQRAHARLKGFSRAAFGTSDLSATPIAQEDQMINLAREKVSRGVLEIRVALKK